MQETLAFLRLAHTKGLGPRKIKLLIDAFNTAKATLEADAFALAQIEGVGPSLIAALEKAKQTDWPEKELQRAQKLNVQLLHLNHAEYPDCLKAIYDPPAVLYVKGQLPKLESMRPRSLGIVGTRNASEQALIFTKRLAESLSSADVVINSGLALGVDTFAHEGAIVNGQTIAVLGSGVDYIYPAKNRGLAKAIAEGKGAVVSEYPLGTRPIATNFPGRNRIINGLSRGIIVVEAGQKSGALITADFALNEGRTVFAVPGRPGDSRSVGSLNLLKQGAVLVDSPEDILNEFNWSAEPVRQLMPELTAAERSIVQAIMKHENPILDTLSQELRKDGSELLISLTMLELKGVIKLSAGSRYICLIPLEA